MNMFHKGRFFVLFLLAPSLLFLFAFTYLPFGVAFVDSLYDFRNVTLGQEYFVGLSNYMRLFNDPTFHKAVINNLVLIALTVPASLVLALLLAIALTQNTTINRMLRSVFFFPTVIPLVAASALWIFIFLPGSGLIDYYLTRYFGTMSHNFLGNQDTALAALAVLTVWKFSGYYMIFFLAGLQSIPQDALEAVHMEGASRWQAFRLVTFPQLRPTLTFVGTIALIYAVTQVDHIMMMTNGGPNNATNVLLFYIFTTAQDGFDLGKASAATALTMGGLLIVTLMNLHVMERGVHYEHDA